MSSGLEIGSRVKVYWEKDNTWFFGVIDKKMKGSMYNIKYDDGDVKKEPARDVILVELEDSSSSSSSNSNSKTDDSTQKRTIDQVTSVPLASKKKSKKSSFKVPDVLLHHKNSAKKKSKSATLTLTTPTNQKINTSMERPSPSLRLNLAISSEMHAAASNSGGLVHIDSPPVPRLPQTPVSAKSRIRTTLHTAVLNADLSIVKTELEKVLSTVGVRGMDRKDGDGYTPMMTVGFIISFFENPYMIQKLRSTMYLLFFFSFFFLSFFLSLSCLCSVFNHQQASALKNQTIGLEILKMLSSNGADPSISDNNGFQAIHWAAAVGNTRTLTYLVNEYQVNVNVPSTGPKDEQETPLHRAARLGRIDTIHLLLKQLNANPDVKDKKGRSPFDVAGIVEVNGIRQGAPSAKVVRAVRTAICEHASNYQTLILHHVDCGGHKTPDGHFEGADRIDAILNKLNGAGLTNSSLIRESSNFNLANYNQLIRCHSEEYIRFLNSLHDDVNSSGQEVSFTPRVQRDIRHTTEPTKEWSDTVFTKGSLAAALRAVGKSFCCEVKIVVDFSY